MTRVWSPGNGPTLPSDHLSPGPGSQHVTGHVNNVITVTHDGWWWGWWGWDNDMHNGPHWPSHTICAGPSYSNYPLRRSEMDVSLFPWWKVSRLSCNLTATRQDSRCCFYAGFVAQCSLLRAFLTFPTELWHKILRWKACSKLLYWVQTEKHNLYSSREYLEIRSFPTEYTSLNFKLITSTQEDWD